MDRPGVSKKYHQHEDSGVHAYFPSGVKLNTGSIVLVEGEKKGLALQDQGIASIGISGFHGFQRKEDEKQRLLDELDFLGIYNGQEGLEFLGDNDTTLNHQFADAVIQLMDRLGKQPETSGVMVTLPRIPFGEQKGVDDLIQKWLDEGLDPKTEYQKLERVTISLKEDGGKRGAADLRWKLLKVELDRDREGLKALVESSAKEAERLFKLIVRMKDAAISQKAAKDAIRDLLGMEKREFNAALKQAQDSLSAGVSDSPNADGETVPECIERVVGSGYNYSGGKYLYPDLNGNYTDYSREELKSHLRMFEGLSAKAGPNAPDGLPPVEEALIEIKAKPRLYHFGPVAGHPAGLHKRGENEFLVTAGPTIPKGVVGSCTTYRRILRLICGFETNEPFAQKQFDVVILWMKQFRKMLLNINEDRPGQFLAFVGPNGAGKTWSQTQVLSRPVGGRQYLAKIQNLSQQHNAQTTGIELVIFSDSADEDDYANRAKVGRFLKELVANPERTSHEKFKTEVCLPIRQRNTASLNSDEIAALPALKTSNKDKFTYLKAYGVKLFEGADDPRCKEIHQALDDELEAFCHYIDNYEASPELYDSRFGVIGWQHPELVELADEGKPTDNLSEIIHSEMKDWTQRGAVEVSQPAHVWFDVLTVGLEAKTRPAKTPVGLGKMFARLESELKEDANCRPFRISKKRENARGTVWTIGFLPEEAERRIKVAQREEAEKARKQKEEDAKREKKREQEPKSKKQDPKSSRDVTEALSKAQKKIIEGRKQGARNAKTLING
jgi:hypothetical protein